MFLGNHQAQKVLADKRLSSPPLQTAHEAASEKSMNNTACVIGLLESLVTWFTMKHSHRS